MRTAFSLLLVACFTLPAQAVVPTRTFLVFPFENQSDNADLGWMSEGLADLLSARLAGPSRVALDRADRDQAYEQLGIPRGTPLTLASEFKVAEKLGVDWALVGSFKVEGKQLRESAQWLDVHALRLDAPLEASGELADLSDLQSLLAWRLLAAHDPSFTTGSEEDFARAFPAVRLDAFENYIRGILAADEASKLHFLREADRLNPSDHRAALELGRHFFQTKDYSASSKWLRKLVPTDDGYFESLFLLGVNAFFLGQDSEAEKAFGALSQQIPLNEVWNNLGVIEARRNHYGEALASFQRAYQGDPNDADFCFNVGTALWYLKRYSSAERYFREALQADGDDPGAHAALALVMEKLGDTPGERRERAWLAAHESQADPASEAVAGEEGPPPLGAGAGGARRGDEDIQPFPRLKKNYDGRAFRLLALAVNNALEARLTQEPPAEHADVHLSRGQRFLSQGRMPEAERELDEAVSLSPQSSEAHLLLGQVYESEGKHPEAAREMESALQIDNNAVTHLWLARIYLSLHRRDLALQHAQAALRLNPADADAERLLEALHNHQAEEKKP